MHVHDENKFDSIHIQYRDVWEIGQEDNRRLSVIGKNGVLDHVYYDFKAPWIGYPLSAKWGHAG